MWNQRYSQSEYVYGVEPNEYLVKASGNIRPGGKVLSLGEGEGRNAVYLASQGFNVTAVDSSSVGLEKAQKLADSKRVKIDTITADLADFEIKPGSWDAIISIYCHLPSAQRVKLHQQVCAGLKPGGVFILEAFTPRQLLFGTGGPSSPDMLMTLEGLRIELDGLKLEHAVELDRSVLEGTFHTGQAAVVQITGIK
ncbi:MAG: class I SAM-dependent methyltransferase [Chloroflexota bacterium]